MTQYVMNIEAPELTKNARTANRLFLFAHIVALATIMFIGLFGGDAGVVALLGSMTGFVLAWWGFIKKEKVTKWTKWVFAVFVVIPTLVFLLHLVTLAEMLW